MWQIFHLGKGAKIRIHDLRTRVSSQVGTSALNVYSHINNLVFYLLKGLIEQIGWKFS